MTGLSGKIEHAQAMFRAGSYERARELCQEVLEKEDDNIEAFKILFKTRMEQKNYGKALAICNWRLERVPDCIDAHMLKILPLGHWKQKKEAAKLIETIRHRFGHHPFHLEQSEILYSHFFKNSGHTLWLLRTAREKGFISEHWLDEIESYERSKSGHVFTSQKLLKEALERNPENYESLYSLAITRFYVGRLISAIRLARQAKRLNPERAAECKEVIFASFVGLIPFFWGAQFFIIWVATVTTRIPWLLRSPLNIAGFFMAFLVQGFVLMPLGLLMGGSVDEPHTESTSGFIGILVILQFIWIIYILFGFQRIGQSFSDSRKDVKLSKKY